MNTVFVNPERCVGCRQCEAACAVAHSRSRNVFLAVFENPPPKQRIHAEVGLAAGESFPNKCRHCNPAPCLAVCPTAAIRRAEDFPGIVLIDQGRCIACGMCAVVCPFDVITYHASWMAPERELVATKCDDCIDRQRAGQVPACVEVCKVDALAFGDINELTKRARQRFSASVSTSVREAQFEPDRLPAGMEAWRSWGRAAKALNAATIQER